MSSNFEIMCGDAAEFLRSLPEGSVDLLLTDPPYGTTDCEWDKSAPDWSALWPLVWRALKPNGAAIVFSQLPPALDVILPARRHFRHEFIWHKTQPAGMLNANRCPMRAHELALVFARRQPGYNRISIPEQTGAPYRNESNRAGKVYAFKRDRIPSESIHGERALQDVIRLGLEGDEMRLHPTRKPRRLLQYLIRAYTQPGGLVMDCFCGSGGCAEACKLEGRRFAGCDASPEYAALARRRVDETCPPPPARFWRQRGTA